MRKILYVMALCLAGSFFAVGRAHAIVIVLGNALGHDCYLVAEFGDPVMAFDTCSNALYQQSLSPHDRAATYANRSVVRIRVKDFSGALHDVDECIAIAPTIAEAYVNRGAVLLNLKRPEEALVDLNKAIDMNVDKLHLAYYNRGMAKEELNDTPGALADYKKAFELEPTFPLAIQEIQRLEPSWMPPPVKKVT